MAVKMRLRREGKKKQPHYRIVVADSRSPRDGRFVEDLGYYQPLADPSTIKLDHDRALEWLRHGAQPSSAVENLLRVEGVWAAFRPGEADPSAERRQRRAERRAERERRRGPSTTEPAAPAAPADEPRAAAPAAPADEPQAAGEPAVAAAAEPQAAAQPEAAPEPQAADEPQAGEAAQTGEQDQAADEPQAGEAAEAGEAAQTGEEAQAADAGGGDEPQDAEDRQA